MHLSEFMPFLLFLVGFVIIIKGSDWFVDSAIWIAKVLDVPNIIIGATLVSICTTLPEAMVSASSSLRGNSSIAIGNALGSIMCNTGFILGITLIFSRPPINDRKRFFKNGKFLLFCLLFVTAFVATTNEISRTTGFILLGFLILYLTNNIIDAKQFADEHEDEPVDKSRPTFFKNISLFIIGITMTVIGSNLLVSNGEKIAILFGVPDIIIGLTMTAFGTSLPELMTAITAIRKKAYNISVGNVIGANILNIVLVVGLSSVILPIKGTMQLLYFHLPATFVICTSLLISAIINKDRFKRLSGVVLVFLYALYLYLLLFSGIVS